MTTITNPPSKTIVTWYGVNISEMSRDELEAAFRQLGKEYELELSERRKREKESVREIYELAERGIYVNR